ncbi:MAG: pyrroloquinoline quinone-dependent dehydrogenase [Terriglobia bacterium]|jgi:quinoprotein glucose dehydrogenase
MRHRVNRRTFLKQSASTWLAASAWPAAAPPASKTEGEWRTSGGNLAGMRYSPLDQINHSNVHKLQVAWTYHTGDGRDKPSTTIECTPLVVNGVMYLTTAQLKLCALEAATGKLLWQFDPFEGLGEDTPRGVNRGVAYWEDGNDQRIFFVARARLMAFDARTGKLIHEFGQGGSVDLTKGLGRDLRDLTYDVTSPGIIYKNLIIVGSMCGEGPEPAAPGHVRAFDVRTGVMAWIFHTIPRAGEPGNETWEDNSWRTAGAANDWGGMTVDEKRGWVFLSTGSAAFDFYGGQRLGQNLFANCVIALDASTGKRLWHYQVVHHDLWDRDLPCPPALVTLKINGKSVDAVVQPTKFGQLFVLERETGKPLYPVAEQPVPESDVPGEKAWATQPQSLKLPPYTRQVFKEDDVTNISPEAHAAALGTFQKSRSGTWQPPSAQGTIIFPGFDGGSNWGGGSFDPTTSWYYINSHDEPWILTLVPAPDGAGYPYTHTGYNHFVDAEGYAAIKPPWGQLTAYNLNKGEIVWQAVLGEFQELTARGLPPTGTQNIGGSVVTAGGLVFIGATQDEKFRAFDKTNGKVLWEAQVPAGGYASPCTYEVKGKQYVIIAAGGGGKLRTRSGDAYVAFALP